MAIQAQMYSENLGFQLCGSQDWIMDNGCGGVGGLNHFGYNPQQKQQLPQQHLQQLQNQQQRNQNLSFENGYLASAMKNNTNAVTFNCHLPIMQHSQSIASQFESQRQEIDQYIRIQQNERLRLVLQEQRNQHVAGLLKKIESKTSVLLRQKDEEIAKAVNRTMELEVFLRRLEAENQAWQRVAQENEAMVASLNNTLEQVLERSPCGINNGAEDAESCCDVDRNPEQYEEEEEEKQNREGLYMLCKSCNIRGVLMHKNNSDF
ncbi:hypothetical protein I3760_06G123500 [Carya illinoinensis]|nr:hypothetical protein I3760_06G123500 [Carya illinoinensis]